MTDFKCEITYSSKIDIKLEKKIMKCFNETFNQSKPQKYFKWKYKDNPFGESIHVLIYFENELVSTRVFWRLDVNQEKSYQCVDTTVSPLFQGRGLFRISTEKALEILNHERIFNYPNSKSYPAYLKLGWKKNLPSQIKFNFSYKIEKYAPFIDWGIEKLVWRFKDNPNTEYFSFYSNNYNIILRKKRGLFICLGKTKFELGLKKVKPIVIFSYDNDFKGLRVPFKRNFTVSKNFTNEKIHFYNYDMM